jgi:Rieske Fe-S protein
MSRRAFLDATTGCTVAVIAAMRLNTRELLALPIVETTGERAGNEWRSPIPASDSVNIDHKAQVILARAQGHVFVFNLACPHQNAAV